MGDDGTDKVWHWVELSDPPLTLAAGTNTIEFLNREDGALVDQVLITTTGRAYQNAAQPVTPGVLVSAN